MSDTGFRNVGAKELHVNSWRVQNTFLCFSHVHPSGGPVRAHSVHGDFARQRSRVWIPIIRRPPLSSDVFPRKSAEHSAQRCFDEQSAMRGDSPLPKDTSGTECEMAVSATTSNASQATEGSVRKEQGPDTMTTMQIDLACSCTQDDMEGPGQEGERDPGTTVMLRNIACCYTQEDVAAILDEHGFAGRYDFIYMPRPSRCATGKKTNFGYVFVNFTHPQFVEDCTGRFRGKIFGERGTKSCAIMPARIQGEMNCKRSFKKKSQKHQSLPLVVTR